MNEKEKNSGTKECVAVDESNRCLQLNCSDEPKVFTFDFVANQQCPQVRVNFTFVAVNIKWIFGDSLSPEFKEK